MRRTVPEIGATQRAARFSLSDDSSKREARPAASGAWTCAHCRAQRLRPARLELRANASECDCQRGARTARARRGGCWSTGDIYSSRWSPRSGAYLASGHHTPPTHPYRPTRHRPTMVRRLRRRVPDPPHGPRAWTALPCLPRGADGRPMQSWFVEDNFGRQWRFSLEPLEPPVGTTLLSRETAEEVVFTLVYFSMGGASASRARVVAVLCAIGEAVCMRIGALPRGPEAVRVALGEEGLDEQLRFREAIASSLEAAVAYGRLHVYSVAEPQVASDWSPPVSTRHDRPLPLVSESSLTWFEVRVVDTFGAPIAGVELVLSRGALRQTTNGSGTARWSGVEGESSIATARVERLSDLRQRLLPDWGQSAARASARSAEADQQRRSIFASEITASLRSEEPLTLVLDNPVRRIRLVGMHFDTNKCFLLEPAMNGIRRVVEAYRAHPNGTFVVAGHTDRSGDEAFNLDLSLERAEAVIAYLRDDVASWEAWFGETKVDGKRWGAGEVSAMLHALPCDGTIRGFQAWSNANRGTALEVDGVAGQATRRALIGAYMALDGTSLPKSVTLLPHGCGEYFPRAEDDVGTRVDREPEDRRVEIFCFHGEAQPPVPGKKARKNATEYDAWQRQVTEQVDFEAASSILHVVDDVTRRPMSAVTVHIQHATGDVRAYLSNERGEVVVPANRGDLLKVVGVEHATHSTVSHVLPLET